MLCGENKEVKDFALIYALEEIAAYAFSFKAVGEVNVCYLHGYI